MASRHPCRQVVLALCIALATVVAGCGGSIGDDGRTDDDGKADDPGDGDDGGDDGGDDIPDETCPGVPCDLHDQCGCTEGQACDLDGAAFATGGTECREVTTAGQSQANCDTSADCAAGYGCFGNPGQCRRYCQEDGDCGGGYCSIQVVYDAGGGDWQDVPDAKICTKSCKPESPEGGCPSDRACDFYYEDPNATPDSGDEYWYTDCRPEGNGGNAASCEANGNISCQSGYGCFALTYSDDTVKDECRQICIWAVNDKAGSRECDVGTCHEVGGAGIVINGTEYGIWF